MKRKSEERISVLVAFPQMLFSQALAVGLRDRYHFEVPSVHPTTGEAAVALASELLPDVLVCDAWLPDLPGPALVERSRSAASGSKLILLSAHHRPDHVEKILDMGAAGFLPKSIRLDRLADGIRRAHDGEIPIFSKELKNMVEAMRQRHRESERALRLLDPLTSRERTVLAWLASGASTDVIAEALFISPTTVKNHVKHLLSKTGTGTRTELLALARLAGAVAAPPSTHTFPFSGKARRRQRNRR